MADSDLVVEAAPDLGVRVLTLYAFSTENWKRTQAEVSGLMTLFRRYISRESRNLLENGVRVRFIGDRVRLADTELFVEVEDDMTVYGDEVKFGGGKVIRDGMGQSQHPASEVADVVITNALIVDHWGIVKADIGIKNGRIVGIGKAGKPDVQPAVDIIIGPGTEAIAGEGQYLGVFALRLECCLHAGSNGTGVFK